MATVTSELIWIKTFIAAIGIFHTSCMKFFYDNQAVLHIAKNLIFNERTMHVKIGCCFVLKTNWLISSLKHLQNNNFTFFRASWASNKSLKCTLFWGHFVVFLMENCVLYVIIYAFFFILHLGMVLFYILQVFFQIWPLDECILTPYGCA